MPGVNRVLDKMRSFSESVRSCEWNGGYSSIGNAVTYLIQICSLALGMRLICRLLAGVEHEVGAQ